MAVGGLAGDGRCAPTGVPPVSVMLLPNASSVLVTSLAVAYVAPLGVTRLLPPDLSAMLGGVLGISEPPGKPNNLGRTGWI